MPTGLTAGVADGTVTDLRGFALICARQFGACIMQRDEATSVPPKLREVSPHYQQHIDTARSQLARLEAMTPDEIVTANTAQYDRKLADYLERVEQNTAARNRYNSLLADVIAWEPPTIDHVPLKDLMVKQLTESREWDTYELEPPRREDPIAHHARLQAESMMDIGYYENLLAEEVKRVNESNAWITALYEALSPSPLQEPNNP